ncbi:hypothetical protein BH09SUM1_BH09SUM1_27180 [soil metagenome]
MPRSRMTRSGNRVEDESCNSSFIPLPSFLSVVLRKREHEEAEERETEHHENHRLASSCETVFEYRLEHTAVNGY